MHLGILMHEAVLLCLLHIVRIQFVFLALDKKKQKNALRHIQNTEQIYVITYKNVNLKMFAVEQCIYSLQDFNVSNCQIVS